LGFGLKHSERVCGGCERKPGILQGREATPAKLKPIWEHPKHNREVKALQD